MDSFFLTGADADALDAAALGFSPFQGQLFNRHDPEVIDSLASRDLLIRLGEDPNDFLDRLPPGGFVLPHAHARDVAWACVWGYLRREKRHAIIVECDPLRTILKYRPKLSYVDPKELERVGISHQNVTKELVKYFKHSPQTIIPPQPFEPRHRVENWNEIKDLYESLRGIPRQ